MELAAIREHGLLRQLRRIDSPQSPRITFDGRRYLNFSSNDYLGLAGHPSVCDAATRAVANYGAGSGSARLICGSLAPHHQLEETLAAFKGTEAALTFSSGYATALGTIGALVGRGDVIIIDRLVHASVVDAARLCGAKLRVFVHNDMTQLEKILRWADTRRSSPSRTPAARRPRILVVTESVFSMDGDCAPLRNIVELKDRYGAWLMLDEAHATGFFGSHRRGLADRDGVSGQIDVQMGTLGKALGASGGYICGSQVLIDLLIHRARSFVFSTAPIPAAAAAADAAIKLVMNDFGKVQSERLWAHVRRFTASAAARFPARSPAPSSPILPIPIGAERAATDAAARLSDRGIYAPAIRYPTVPRGEARLRFTLTAAHTEAEVSHAVDVLAEICRPLETDQ